MSSMKKLLLLFVAMATIVIGCNDKFDGSSTAPILSSTEAQMLDDDFQHGLRVMLGKDEDNLKEVVPVEWDGISPLNDGTVYRLSSDKYDALAERMPQLGKWLSSIIITRRGAKVKSSTSTDLATYAFSGDGSIFVDTRTYCYGDSGRGLSYSTFSTNNDHGNAYHAHWIDWITDTEMILRTDIWPNYVYMRTIVDIPSADWQNYVYALAFGMHDDDDVTVYEEYP